VWYAYPPTLLDVAGVTGLKPTGQTFDPDSHHSEMTFDFSRLAYGNFTKDQHITTSTDVSDKDHVAFLTYWLSMFIFWSRSIQVPKKFKTLAIQLHEGREICLRKLILGSLYENLNQAITSIKEYQLGSSLIIPGSIWLFQLWLLTTFRTQLAVHPLVAFAKAYEDRATEGIGLAMFRFGNKSSKEVFAITYEFLLKCDVLTFSLVPFTIRVCGPTWFKKNFPATPDEDEAEINAIWKAYLTPTLLSSRITAGGPYGLHGYQRNHVSRQFGLIQPKPSSLYKCLEDLKQPLIEHVWRTKIRHIHERVFAFEPVPFAATFACTKDSFDGGKTITNVKPIEQILTPYFLN